MSRDLIIDHVGAQGDGVAITGDGDGNGHIYVPGTLAGERVKAAVDGDRGRMLDLITASPDRVEPACRHFGICGGCALQHMAPEAYQAWKVERVRRALMQRGFSDVSMRPLVTTSPASRRRARLTAVRTRGGVVLGFNQRHSHQVFEVAVCPVLKPEILAVLPLLRDVLKDLLKPGARGHVHLTASATGLDVLFDLPGQLDLEAREALGALGEAADLARISWGSDAELVIERRRPMVQFGGVAVILPPAGFLQASAEAQEALVAEVCEALTGAERIADLFSGLGTFSFPLATRARVHAFDGDRAAIANLKAATGQLPIEATVRDLFRRPLSSEELGHYDAVLLDPPRAGAKAQVAALAQSQVSTVAMVSCNPATFARDARSLVDGGYGLDWVRPVDQFLWSAEVELVAGFRRG